MERLQKEGSMLIESIVELVYFMRGAIGYEEMMLRTPAERDLIRNFITKRLESQKDSPYPVY